MLPSFILWILLSSSIFVPVAALPLGFWLLPEGHEVHVSEKQSLAKIIAGVRGEVLPPAEVWRRQPTKVFLLTLILTFLPPQGGSGAQPQDFDFLTPDFLFCLSILIIRTLYPSGKRIKIKTLGLRP